jgi:hypothetical protein
VVVLPSSSSSPRPWSVSSAARRSLRAGRNEGDGAGWCARERRRQWRYFPLGEI